MTRDEIYEHLAQVYMGKRQHQEEPEPKPPRQKVWLVLNVGITLFILASVFYGLTAFLAHRTPALKSKVMYSLNNSPIRIQYNVASPYPQVQSFSISTPEIDVSKFSAINLSIRSSEGATPGMVRMIVKNRRHETDSFYITKVTEDWKQVIVPFSEFNVADWTSLTDVTFAIEAWNADSKQGTVLIDDVSFSN